jgi:hypothetical protein
MGYRVKLLFLLFLFFISRGAYNIFARKLRRRWDNNIKMNFHEAEWGVINWTVLAKDRNRWRMLLNAVMNLRVPQKCRKFLN